MGMTDCFVQCFYVCHCCCYDVAKRVSQFCYYVATILFKMSIVVTIFLSFVVHFKDGPPAPPFVHDTDETRASEQVSISHKLFSATFTKSLAIL